jgi:hypothetical protein
MLSWIGGLLPMDPTSVLRELAVALDQVVSSWTSPSTWRRLIRKAAAASVDTLGDVQIVIESILSDEWEGRSTYLRTRRSRESMSVLGENLRRKPDQCVPVGSIGPLGLPANSWGATHGLRRWPEDGPDEKGDCEFVSAERTEV